VAIGLAAFQQFVGIIFYFGEVLWALPSSRRFGSIC
jgi:hypothetical protein